MPSKVGGGRNKREIEGRRRFGMSAIDTVGLTGVDF